MTQPQGIPAIRLTALGAHAMKMVGRPDRSHLKSEDSFGPGTCVDKVNTNKMVATWLNTFLSEHYKSAKVQTFESGRTRLSRLIGELGLGCVFPQCDAWDVKVDVTGIVERTGEAHLVLINYVSKKFTLADVAILLGYARTVEPILCMLISPHPPVDPLITLLKDYGRLDVLQYGRAKRHIRIGKWHEVRREVIPGSIIPPGALL